MEIRPYRETDREQVVELWRTVFPGAPPRNAPELLISCKRSIQPELFLVAEEGSRVVGTTMGGYDGHRGWIYLVAVHPGHRRRGIGSTLVRRAECLLIGMGCPKCNLQVRSSDPEPVAFYESLGFTVEERISMGKELAAAQRSSDPPPRGGARGRALLSLMFLVPLGLYTKVYSGPGSAWVNDSLGGVFYVLFWSIAVFTCFERIRPLHIALWVLAVTCLLEVLQLWNPPPLAWARSTASGRILLGTTFSWSDLPHYLAGAGFGWLWMRGIRAAESGPASG